MDQFHFHEQPNLLQFEQHRAYNHHQIIPCFGQISSHRRDKTQVGDISGDRLFCSN